LSNNRPGEIVDPSNYFIASVPSAAATVKVDTHNRAASGIIYSTKKISDTLYGGYLTCASCHEVHNTDNAVNDPCMSNPSYAELFRMGQGNRLCTVPFMSREITYLGFA
jgi:cytochrome c553